MDQRFELVVYSMGGAITAGHAKDSPQTIRRFMLLAQLEGSTLLRRNGVIYRMCRCWGIGLVHAVFAYQHRLGTEAERLLPSTVLDMVNL